MINISLSPIQESELSENHSTQELILLVCAQLSLHHRQPHNCGQQPQSGAEESGACPQLHNAPQSSIGLLTLRLTPGYYRSKPCFQPRKRNISHL